jgi:hypothetical protein
MHRYIGCLVLKALWVARTPSLRHFCLINQLHVPTCAARPASCAHVMNMVHGRFVIVVALIRAVVVGNNPVVVYQCHVVRQGMEGKHPSWVFCLKLSSAITD